jgi:ribonuclease VapC
MIAVDTSALMAIVLHEPPREACMTVLEGEPQALISAATVAEALIVASRRRVGNRMHQLVTGLALNVVPVTEAAARRAAVAYDRWGRGVHSAALNFGDCFAYEVAMNNNCPLLFVGNDFSQTDIVSAL